MTNDLDPSEATVNVREVMERNDTQKALESINKQFVKEKLNPDSFFELGICGSEIDTIRQALQYSQPIEVDLEDDTDILLNTHDGQDKLKCIVELLKAGKTIKIK